MFQIRLSLGINQQANTSLGIELFEGFAFNYLDNETSPVTK